MKITIYTVYHKPAHVLSVAPITPIQVGPHPDLKREMARDSTGENIASKNATYCELTAQYWVWKNDKESDYVGLAHYRRFLSFGRHRGHADRWGLVVAPAFTRDFMSEFGLSEEAVLGYCSGADIILPRPRDVRRSGYKTLREHYAFGDGQRVEDLDAARDILAAHYPEFVRHYDAVLKGSVASFNNMFVMRRDAYSRYCEWIFDVLLKMEAVVPWQDYDAAGRRVFGYLAERLLNIWISWYRETDPDCIVRYAEPIFVADPSEEAYHAGSGSGVVDRLTVLRVKWRQTLGRARRLLQLLYVHIPLPVRRAVRPYALMMLRVFS